MFRMSEAPPHQPHDKLFKSSFSEPATATAFLQAQLPSGLATRLDWRTLQVQSGSFIDERLQSRESGLLYRIRLQDEAAFLYLLFEHQRQQDPWLPFRLLRYETRVWDKFQKEHPAARRLPPVIPVVLAQMPLRGTLPAASTTS